MDILVVTPTLPAPISGGRTRLFNLVKHLASRHSVSLLSFLQPGEDVLVPRLEAFCHSIQVVPFAGFPALGPWRNRLRGWRRILLSSRPAYARTFPVEGLRAPLRGLVRSMDFDVILFEQLFVAELVEERGEVPAILVEQNVESDLARRRYALAANPVHRLRDWLSWRKLRAHETRLLRQFPVCVAVSERDAALLRAMAPTVQVHVVPNGVDCAWFAPPAEQRAADHLLFLGSLSYAPNVDGLVWFCEKILPRVQQLRPQVTLEIVGLNPAPQVRALHRPPGVRVTGFVPDVRTKLWQATLCVVPLRTGGGTRLKVLEALAAGCPAVSTSVGAEGLSLAGGEHLLIADSEQAFTSAVLALLANGERRRGLANAGRRVVVDRYDWRHLVSLLETACLAAAVPGQAA